MTEAMFTMLLVDYYVFGLVWIGLGLLPGPQRWIDHDGPPLLSVFILVIGAAVWPLILWRLATDLWHGKGRSQL